MIEYKVKNNEILKDGHTMFKLDIARELNRKAFIENRLLLLERACLLKKAVVIGKLALIDELKAVDSWEDDVQLNIFADKYANKEVDIFEQCGDYFILEDNNVVMPAFSFDFI
tara:strand:+ start:767 stop:1105 length:339 start_codon:yes stop_codon:yes gene_type:complete